jgi:hypothetical protein
MRSTRPSKFCFIAPLIHKLPGARSLLPRMASHPETVKDTPNLHKPESQKFKRGEAIALLLVPGYSNRFGFFPKARSTFSPIATTLKLKPRNDAGHEFRSPFALPLAIPLMLQPKHHNLLECCRAEQKDELIDEWAQARG